MNMMSSDNSYYRYTISSSADLGSDTFLRRSAKARQNNKTAFFFEIKSPFENFDLLQTFFAEHMRPQDAILAGLELCKILFSNPICNNCYISIGSSSALTEFLKYFEANTVRTFRVLFEPKTTSDLKNFVQFHNKLNSSVAIFWRFQPYDEKLPRSLTVSDINSQGLPYAKIPGLEIQNTRAPAHYELEPHSGSSYSIKWKFQKAGSKPRLTVIIPTYNNLLFLSNVVWHLVTQNCEKDLYEVIIADDGSSDGSADALLNLFGAYRDQVNITYIYWSKTHPRLGDQHFFRSGLARNLAARYSAGENLLFLDSDMIVPEDFVSIALKELEKNDVIQFQRFHIHQEHSKRNPHYSQVNLKSDTYIEEKNYWSQLFFCSNWSDLPHYWKFTCTYALGISRAAFFEMGMFKKYYISYGFEDTDLGYEAFKRNKKFALVKTPLLHLTAYDQMQYKNSASKRVKLLKVTAELFYLQHLDREIFYLLSDYYRMQKPIKAYFRDLVG
jgi:glycosyltransferase involved in cell wall biosynthesis